MACCDANTLLLCTLLPVLCCWFDPPSCWQTGKMITIPITAGIVGEVVRTKKLCNVADTSKDT